MPYLKLQDRQYPLDAGESTIGAFPGATIPLPGGDPDSRAIVSLGPTGVSIRKGTADSVVMVNGVQLGVEPSPLLHGDKVEIAGFELRLGDDQKGGSTQFVSAADVAKYAAAAKSAPKKPTAATGGRLVSLVDGREYPVPDSGMSFGREVGNEVVIASTEISRKHASIAPTADGYVLTDHSTNGVWVNGSRIADTQLLGRGDVIKMGAEEYRFYADVAKVAPPPPQSAADVPSLAATMIGVPAAVRPKPPAPPVESAPAPAPAVPPSAPIVEPPTAPTPAPVAAAPAAPSARVPGRQALATLAVINEGPLKGTKFELHSALTNIGRGEHNDIAIKDESISDSHAKIQKRPDGWYVVDQGSTNGTYVGGRRVQGEVRIEGAPDLRFGGIKMTFRPAALPASEQAGTRAIAAVNVDALKRQQPAKSAGAAPAAAAPEQKKGCAAVIALVVSIVGAGAGLLSLLLLTGR
ncbi:MAG: FHA domain-containing protein [Gemmatimonadaceae bacterium]